MVAWGPCVSIWFNTFVGPSAPSASANCNNFMALSNHCSRTAVQTPVAYGTAPTSVCVSVFLVVLLSASAVSQHAGVQKPSTGNNGWTHTQELHNTWNNLPSEAAEYVPVSGKQPARSSGEPHENSLHSLPEDGQACHQCSHIRDVTQKMACCAQLSHTNGTTTNRHAGRRLQQDAKCNARFDTDYGIPNGEYRSTVEQSWGNCCYTCSEDPQCFVWVFATSDGGCYLKSTSAANPVFFASPGTISGSLSVPRVAIPVNVIKMMNASYSLGSADQVLTGISSLDICVNQCSNHTGCNMALFQHSGACSLVMLSSFDPVAVVNASSGDIAIILQAPSPPFTVDVGGWYPGDGIPFTGFTGMIQASSADACTGLCNLTPSCFTAEYTAGNTHCFLKHNVTAMERQSSHPEVSTYFKLGLPILSSPTPPAPPDVATSCPSGGFVLPNGYTFKQGDDHSGDDGANGVPCQAVGKKTIAELEALCSGPCEAFNIFFRDNYLQSCFKLNVTTLAPFALMNGPCQGIYVKIGCPTGTYGTGTNCTNCPAGTTSFPNSTTAADCFGLSLTNGDVISLKTFDGVHYVGLSIDNSTLDATATTVGVLETFRVKYLGSVNQYALQCMGVATDSPSYVSNNDGSLLCSARSEAITLHPVTSSSMFMESGSGNYWSAFGGGGSVLGAGPETNGLEAFTYANATGSPPPPPGTLAISPLSPIPPSILPQPLSTTPPTVGDSSSTNSQTALTVGLAVGLGGTALLAVIAAVVVMKRRRKVKRQPLLPNPVKLDSEGVPTASAPASSGSPSASHTAVTIEPAVASTVKSTEETCHKPVSLVASSSAVEVDVRAIFLAMAQQICAAPQPAPLLDVVVTKDTPLVAGLALGVDISKDVAINHVIGKGGSGTVYSGNYQGRPAAVKVVPATDRRYLEELSILGRMCHPNVVSLLGAGVKEKQVYLIMDLADTSLDKLLYDDTDPMEFVPALPVLPPGAGSRRLLPLPMVLSIAIQVAKGLDYLHPTIIHRDLKPGNILINKPSEDGVQSPQVKLTDFGLARMMASVSLLTGTPAAGTISYMAPECFNREAAGLTWRCDIYSFGMCLWEMIHGQYPWLDQDPGLVLFQVVLQHKRPPFTVSEARCPLELQILIERCWDADAMRRPAAIELVVELTNMMQRLGQTL